MINSKNKFHISLQVLASIVVAIGLMIPTSFASAYATTGGVGGYTPHPPEYRTATYSGSGGGTSGTGSGTSGNTMKPGVTTENATNVGYTSATLQASTHIDSGSATVWFQYGTSVNALSYTTLSQTATSSTSGIVGTLPGLASGTKYYFRAVAQNQAGTSYGAVKNFTTVAKKGTATTTSGSTNSTTTTSSGTSSSIETNTSGSLGASVGSASSSSGFFPSSLGGWLLLIIIVFAIAVLVRMIQRDMEQKKEEEEKMKMKMA